MCVRMCVGVYPHRVCCVWGGVHAVWCMCVLWGVWGVCAGRICVWCVLCVCRGVCTPCVWCVGCVHAVCVFGVCCV